MPYHEHAQRRSPFQDVMEGVVNRRESFRGFVAPEVREEVHRHYFAYKRQTNFVDVVPRKDRLLLTLNMRFDEVRDPHGLAYSATIWVRAALRHLNCSF